MNKNSMYRLLCVLIAISLALMLAEAQKSQEGDKYLSEGKYAQAIEAYTAALEADQRDSKILNKRAQAFYLNKQFKSALGDLEKIVDLSTAATISSDLLQAYLLKGKTNLLLGNFEQSVQDYEHVLSLKPGHQEAQSQIGVAQKAHTQTERYLKLSSKEQDKQLLNKCIVDLGEVISTVASESIPLRLKKAECALQLRLFPIVQEEVKRVIARDRRNMHAVLLNSQTMYKLGAVDIALKSLKDFLKTEPDSPKIQKAYKEIRKNEQMLEKANQKMESRNLGEAIVLFKQYLDSNPDAYNVVEISSKICKAYQELGNESDKCIDYCTKTMDLSTGSEESGVGESYMDALLNRAECHIQKDDLESAQHDANQAQQKGNSNRVHELLHKIQRLQRMASRKDHYKVLGLTKGATKDEIKKAYRKLSKMYHPDLAIESKKQEMEKKFKEVTEAYEILSDDEKRRRFDSGEDMDQQQGDHGFGGGHPFFRQGGGGNGGFTFHFGGGGFPFG